MDRLRAMLGIAQTAAVILQRTSEQHYMSCNLILDQIQSLPVVDKLHGNGACFNTLMKRLLAYVMMGSGPLHSNFSSNAIEAF